MRVRRRRPRRAALAAGALVGYVVVLAVVGLWPTAVDRDAGALISAVLDTLPVLSYAGLEWIANVLLFVPAGVLGALMAPRPSTALVIVPFAGLVASSLIETAQSDLLVGRIGSVGDLVANTLGAFVGALLGVGLALLEERRRTRRRARSGPAHAVVGPAGAAPGGGVEAVPPVHDDPAGDQARGVLR